jgi:hypothetical protein
MGDLDAVVDGFADRKRAALQCVAQRFAGEQFRDEVRRAVKGSELVDGEDVGMVECRSGLGFLLEALETVGVAGKKRRQNFDRDFTLQGWIAGAIDLAHSACSKQGENFVGIEFRPSGERHP